MTRPEMDRRLREMTQALRLEMLKMIYEGYGARGIEQNSPATLKQVNAMFEWKSRYGNLIPTDVAIGKE